MAPLNVTNRLVSQIMILRQAEIIVRVYNAYQVMGNKGQLLGAGFSRADIHKTVYLPAISAYYLPTQGLSQLYRQPAFTYRRGPDYGYQMFHITQNF